MRATTTTGRPWTRVLGMMAVAAMVMVGCSDVGDGGLGGNLVDDGPSDGASSGGHDSDDRPDGEPGEGSSDDRDGSVAQPVDFGLQPVASCDALLDHFVANGLDRVTAWGLGGGPGVREGMDGTEELAAADTAEAAPEPAGDSGLDESGGDFSTTNVQEQGVDEPDVVKTDGQLIITVRDQRVMVVDVAAGELVGEVALDSDLFNPQLLLDDDDLVVLAGRGGGGGGPRPASSVPAFDAARTEVMRIDLADPGEPTVLGSVTIEGGIATARMVAGTIRLVVESRPTGLVFTTPEDNGLAAEQEALEENRQRIRDSEIDAWIPHLRTTGPDGTTGDVQRLVDCDQVSQPATFSGFAMLSVVTMDIDDVTMQPSSTAGVVASGDTVYASTDRLIVATSPWGRWMQPFTTGEAEVGERAEEVTTQLHSFDITDPETTTFVGSGQVPGVLVNQFALSELDGIVRVATTMQPAWWGGGGESESALVVLNERDDALVEIGRVDGLGLTERIYAVRYLSDDLAAIVTFRETDPLYLVDTSDPTVPEVTGELKVPGFSTYLHPIGDGRLVAIGQDADDRGRTQGLQVSLFDVSDVADPRRVDQVTFGPGSSVAEYDHHAFTWWAPSNRVVVPAELYPPDRFPEEPTAQDDGAGESGGPDIPDEPGDVIAPPRPTKPFVGIVSVDVEGDDLVEGPRASQVDDRDDPWRGYVERTLVIGSDLWSLGQDTLVRHDLDTLEVLERIRLR